MALADGTITLHSFTTDGFGDASRSLPANGVIYCTWFQPMQWVETGPDTDQYTLDPLGSPITGDDARVLGPVLRYSLVEDSEVTSIPCTADTDGWVIDLSLSDTNRLQLDASHYWFSANYVTGRNAEPGYVRSLGHIGQVSNPPSFTHHDSLVGSGIIRIFTTGGGVEVHDHPFEDEPWDRFNIASGAGRELWMKLEVFEDDPGGMASAGGGDEGAWTEGDVSTHLSLMGTMNTNLNLIAGATIDTSEYWSDFDAVTIPAWSALFQAMAYALAEVQPDVESIADDTSAIRALLDSTTGSFGLADMPAYFIPDELSPDEVEDRQEERALLNDHGFVMPNIPESPGPAPPVWEFTVPLESIGLAFAFGGLDDLDMEIDFAFFAPYQGAWHGLIIVGFTIWSMGRVWREVEVR